MSAKLFAHAKMLTNHLIQSEAIYCKSLPPAPPSQLEHMRDTSDGDGDGYACRSSALPMLRADAVEEIVTMPDILMAQQLFRYGALADCEGAPRGRDICMTIKTPEVDPTHPTNKQESEAVLDSFLRRGVGTILNLRSDNGLAFDVSTPWKIQFPAEAPRNMVHNFAGPLSLSAADDCSMEQSCAPRLVVFGGLAELAATHRRVRVRAGTGIFLSTAISLRGPWNGTRMAISGSHPGCIECDPRPIRTHHPQSF